MTHEAQGEVAARPSPRPREPDRSPHAAGRIGIVGAVVVAIGIILIPFPGPGWLIVLGGLAIWAIEFVWAQRLLQFTRAQLERWWHWLGRQNIVVRLLAGLIGLVFVGTVVYFSVSRSFGVTLSDFWNYISTH